MSMQIENATQSEVKAISHNKSAKTIARDHLNTPRQLHVLAITLLPPLGFIVALLSLWSKPIDLFDVGLLIGMFTLTAIGIEVGYHRYFSHRSFQATTAVSVALGILGSMAAQGPLIYWVGLHRRHHEYSDKPNDPHSPNLHGEGCLGRVRGLWHSHIGWMFNHQTPNPIFYSPELLRNKVISRVNQLYFVWLLLGLAIPAFLGGVLRGSWTGAWYGFLWGGLVRLFVGENMVWTINSVVHVYGSRPFNTRDQSRNNIWLAIPTLGGAWHNNHHAFPNSAINGQKWWQIDISGWIIRALEFSGLVWNVNVPTVQLIKSKLDA